MTVRHMRTTSPAWKTLIQTYRMMVEMLRSRRLIVKH